MYCSSFFPKLGLKDIKAFTQPYFAYISPNVQMFLSPFLRLFGYVHTPLASRRMVLISFVN